VVVRVRRLVYRLAHRGRRLWRRARNPATHGVKGVVVCDGELLLVRHTYGLDRWELPGGSIRRGEDPLACLARELAEELGITPTSASLIETFSGGGGRHLTDLCRVELDSRALRVNAAEIAEARWCDPAAPPSPLGAMVELALSRMTWPQSETR